MSPASPEVGAVPLCCAVHDPDVDKQRSLAEAAKRGRPWGGQDLARGNKARSEQAADLGEVVEGG
jgi:hypothetical protein